MLISRPASAFLNEWTFEDKLKISNSRAKCLQSITNDDLDEDPISPSKRAQTALQVRKEIIVVTDDSSNEETIASSQKSESQRITRSAKAR